METENKNKSFIGYEYREITAGNDIEPLYVDYYECFGWELESITANKANPGEAEKSRLKFKRNRKIRNKAELSRLQKHFDACINEIQKMENSKSTSAMIVAFTVGLIGTAFLAGATFSYLAGMIILCIILAIPGFIGWYVPYFLYKSTYSKKDIELTPLIEAKYDEIYEICKNANGLLS